MRSVLDKGRRAVTISGAIDPLVLLCVGQRNGSLASVPVFGVSPRSVIEPIEGDTPPWQNIGVRPEISF